MMQCWMVTFETWLNTLTVASTAHRKSEWSSTMPDSVSPSAGFRISAPPTRRSSTASPGRMRIWVMMMLLARRIRL